ncbi:hypothetical protein HU200_020017 [Digitaria exilis]|uniref:Uncharacterized protein n=1 Tax=Digitaria exilis TaxID=1010633 RepID=A0A835F152_9POAL|nr:hypothetical protein HU200_020017 [Digitaria exilis]
MSRLGHRRQPSIIPENVAVVQFEEIMVDDPIASQKRSPKEDTPYVGNEIKYQSITDLNTDKKVNNKSIQVDGKAKNDNEGLKDLASQVNTSLVIKDI